MKLTNLTQEQKDSLEVKKQAAISKWLNSEKINDKIAKEVIAFVYSLINLSMPKIYKAPNPMEAQVLANTLKGTSNKAYAFGTFLTSYWASFYAYYDTFVDFGIITEDKFPKYFQLRKVVDSNIFMTIEFEKAIILVEKPMVCKKNSVGLHSIEGKAIQWEDGYGLYYVNGRKIPEEQFLMAKNGTVTKELWLKEKNEDIKAAWFEILGSEKVMGILEAQEIERKELTHVVTDYKNHGKEISGYHEEKEVVVLYKTSFSLPEIGEPLAWVKFICPSTGATYLISVNPKHNDVMSAVLDTCPFYGQEVKTDKDYIFNARG